VSSRFPSLLLAGAGEAANPSGEAERGGVLFENADWTLTAEGLEHRDTGYFVGRGQLGERRADGLWTWPVHLLEKNWCRPRPFGEAFLTAVAQFGLEPDAELAASLLAVDGFRARNAVKAVGLPEGETEPVRLGTLLPATLAPALRARAERSAAHAPRLRRLG